jgi:hypothetical protein
MPANGRWDLIRRIKVNIWFAQGMKYQPWVSVLLYPVQSFPPWERFRELNHASKSSKELIFSVDVRRQALGVGLRSRDVAIYISWCRAAAS